MDEDAQNSQTLFPHETGHGHHRSARERQRQGPMWGCLKTIFLLFAGALILLVIVVGGGFWYLGTSSFAGLVAERIATTLKARLGRNVTIGSVQIDNVHLRQVVLNDVRIANAPGAVTPYFATVKKIVITGGVDSFWRRSIKVGRVDVIEPRVEFEIFPEGSALTHNFPHWNAGPQSRFEIVHVTVGTLFVTNGAFTFLDRRHQISAAANNITSQINITQARDLYAGVIASPQMTVRIQDYLPVDFDLRGGFRYTPGKLALQSIAMRGRGVDVFVSGNVAPLSDGVYNLRITSQAELDRVRQIFRVDRTLKGIVSMDARLRGKQGTFAMTGGWVSPDIVADAYELTNAKGTLNITGDRALVDVTSARFGGGTINAHYTLANYGEPYPMNVDLHYSGVSVESLFNDWTVVNTGLRSAATGRLVYHWNKDKILEGAGEGTAQLAKMGASGTGAKYPIPVSGTTDFALDNGVVTFRRAELDTDASHISLTGTLRISDLFTNLLAQIHSNDFAELDRLGYDFAHATGKKTYTLLGLGGTGDISGSINGPMKTPVVVAHITGTGTKYNNVLLGASAIDLRYDGRKDTLTFDRAIFNEAGGRLALTGTIGFPARGPIRFDLAADATNFPVDAAMAAVDLKLNFGGGTGTGRMTVTGTPEEGKVTFIDMVVHQGTSQLRLAGDVNWAPGKGNVRFNLDMAARDFPVKSILTFLDMATAPVTGQLTGTLHLEGPKSALEGAGAITVRNGTIAGEPVTQATAEINFTKGTVKATNVVVTGPAGRITGEAQMNLTTNQFSYNITAANIDLSKVGALAGLNNLIGGKLDITSSGAGTTGNPELVVTATLNQATLRGLTLPPGAPPPTLYIAIRGGQLVIKGSAANVLTIDGSGTVGQDFTVNGNVRVAITDIAKLFAMSPNLATIPATGRLEIDLALGGKLTGLDTLTVTGTVPTFDVRVSEHEFTPRAPIRFSLERGRFRFDSFDLQRAGAAFAITGFADLVGRKELAIGVKGELEAALLGLFMKDVRADGHVALDLSIGGTLSDPALRGTAELQNAQVKFAGFPQLIDNINGTLRFDSTGVRIDALHANIGGGTVVAGGTIGLNGLTPSSFRVTLQTLPGTEVAIRYFEGVTVAGTFEMQLSGDLERAVLQGNVNVTRALYFKDFNFQQSLLNVVLSRRGITPIVSASWQDRVSLQLHLSADNTLAVRNNVANVTGTADLDLSGTLANPVILGSVTLNEGGTVTFQKINYNVVRGSINFQNPFRIDPYFDITLTGRVSSVTSSDIESGPIDVTVNITGTLDRITPTISSEPPTSDITLFSILGFGGLAPREGATTAPTLTGSSEGLLLSSLSTALASRVFPFVDSFTYDPGNIDTTLGPGRKVSFQKRVSNQVNVLVVYNLDNTKAHEVVEWSANRDWTFQFTNDEEKREYRLDARFRRLYAGRWSLFGYGRGEEIFPVPTMTGVLSPVAMAPVPATTTVEPIPAGTIVSSVQFRYDRPLATTPVADYVTVKAGQPLTIRDVQNTIKALFATGNFSDVRVSTAPAAGGAVVTFTMYVNYRVGQIAYDGLRGSERTRATRDIRVFSGDILSLNAVDNSATSIQQELNRDGYLEATVDPETNYVSERNIANVTFHITKGPRAKVATVTLEGNLQPFTESQLIGRMRGKPGAPFRLDDARSDAYRMRSFVARQDYRRADVAYLGNTYDRTTKTVALRYRANVGPLVKVEVTGVSRSSIKSALPFTGAQEYSEDAVDRAADNIVLLLQERGFINAAVDTESKMVDGTWVTTFHVRPGQKYELAGVTFTGNTKVPAKDLEGVVETSPPGGIRHIFAKLFRRPEGVTQAQLSADRDAIESYYRLHGFTTATVGTPATITHPDDTLTVDFPITEGPQTIVSGLFIEGAQQVNPRQLPKMQLVRGEPLNPQLEREDIVALQSFYADRGNAEVQVSPRVDISADKTEARVTYTVAEGPRVHVGDVVVRGNTYTESGVILRKAELKKDEPFSYTSLLEAQRNLYRLGIFNRVDIQPEQAGTSVDDRNVTISVDEGKDLTASGSVGLAYNRTATGNRIAPRFVGALAHRNLFGTGRYLGFQGVYAPHLDREAYLTYQEPFIFHYNVPLSVTLFQTDDATRDFARIRQNGVSLEASKVVLEQTRWSLQYQYKISKCYQGKTCEDVAAGIPVPTLPRGLLDIQISSVTPTFFWDRRDDIIDPHHGFFTSASVTYAFPMISANADFVKEFMQGAWYLPVSARSVFALSGRLGFIQPLGHTEETRFVPPSERFLGGGASSDRAYPLDLLGNLCFDPDESKHHCVPTLYNLSDPSVTNPKDFQLAPLGGNSLLIMNAEYRFPFAGPVGGAVFTDVGNVFGTTAIQLDNLRYGAGFGFRYMSPVGPLRIDIGFPLQRRSYEHPFAYSFSLGLPF